MFIGYLLYVSYYIYSNKVIIFKSVHKGIVKKYQELVPRQFFEKHWTKRISLSIVASLYSVWVMESSSWFPSARN